MSFEPGWEALDRLPPRSRRTEAERKEATLIRDSILGETQRFARSNRREIYDRLTDGCARRVRVDDLVYRAADLWPGLVPTREEVARRPRGCRPTRTAARFCRAFSSPSS